MEEESKIILYTTPEGAVKVKAVLKDETMWITQAGMADLFDVAPQNITYHLKKIYASGELSEAATCKEILQVQNEGTGSKLMSWLPKRDKLDPMQASAIDFAVAQEGNVYIKGEIGTGKSVVRTHVAAKLVRGAWG